MPEELTAEQAEDELRELIETKLRGWWAGPFAVVSGEIVEHLVLERQDIIAALHEHPRRWWFYHEVENVWPLVWLGGDEFNNRTIVFRIPGRRQLVVALNVPLRKVLDRS